MPIQISHLVAVTSTTNVYYGVPRRATISRVQLAVYICIYVCIGMYLDTICPYDVSTQSSVILWKRATYEECHTSQGRMTIDAGNRMRAVFL